MSDAYLTPAELQAALARQEAELNKRYDDREKEYGAIISNRDEQLKKQQSVLDSIADSNTGRIDCTRLSPGEYLALRATPEGRKRLGLKA